MPLGPVFHAELITTARRARYYVVRTIYGSIILFQIYLSYQANAWRFNQGRADLLISEMSAFGRQTFASFAILQMVVLLLLTPALVGGTIADERQRKTLHYLLTSQLGGLEIVVGKLAARLLHVCVLVALGLPMVSLIGLIGGIDFWALLVSYAGTMTTVYFLSGLSILVSVHSRRPREAIMVLYIYGLVWLFVPTLVVSTMRQWPDPWPAIEPWLNPVLEYVAVTSPLYLAYVQTVSRGRLESTLYWGMGLQIFVGTAFILIAAWRLRPASRNDGTKRGLSLKLSNLSRKRSWFPRPECGDDAMLWKERYVARTGGMTKVALGLIALSAFGIVGYAMIDFVRPAFIEMIRDGYFVVGSARRDFNIFLRSVSTGIFVIWSLGVAAGAASGFTSEREEDTWISLISTPLSGEEILRGKMVGPAWSLRYLIYLMVATWVIGLAVGSIHPFGIAACAVELIVFSWFLTALGIAFSLKSKNSTRSLALTMVTLVFLNGGYLFCCIPFRPNTGVITAGSTPVIFAISLASFENLNDLGSRNQGEMVAASILGTFFYAVAAAGLTAWVYQSFDIAVDRPDRFRRELTIGQQKEMLKNRPKDIIYQDDLS